MGYSIFSFPSRSSEWTSRANNVATACTMIWNLYCHFTLKWWGREMGVCNNYQIIVNIQLHENDFSKKNLHWAFCCCTEQVHMRQCKWAHSQLNEKHESLLVLPWQHAYASRCSAPYHAITQWQTQSLKNSIMIKAKSKKQQSGVHKMHIRSFSLKSVLA